MASGGKRGGAGERVLEGRHVIGLFMLMLLFSGVFFTLGYVMGRNQNDGQVSAATGLRNFVTPDVLPKTKNDTASKNSSKKPAADPQTSEPAPPSSSDWEFYHAGDSSKADDRFKPTMTPVAPTGKNGGSARQVNTPSKTGFGNPAAGINLQVSATTHEADALALANTLRRKNFPTFVQPPQGDKFYHVLVGPYADQKAVENARKALEAAGFKKAIVKR